MFRPLLGDSMFFLSENSKFIVQAGAEADLEFGKGGALC